ncbi:hypothetical protein VL20_4555 [Microcystis panniformis FACHB-1757]|uniref:Uncharacterized protein n=1 Tax=Microcystis panniformis FACHB-1757 TaxID=1638788 RepID=A0A0K1S621_9CHRO|nr:hypothetical protein VL20_4555 [Microcystis panniformis FACHB-1757]
MLLPLAQICATMEGNIEDLISLSSSAGHWKILDNYYKKL